MNTANMDEITNLAKVLALRDVETALVKRQTLGEIVPDNVFEVLEELEAEYMKIKYPNTFTSAKQEELPEVIK